MSAKLDPILANAKVPGFTDRIIKELAEALGKKSDLKEDRFALVDLWGDTDRSLDTFSAYMPSGVEFSPVSGRREFTGNIWESLIAHPWYNLYEELTAIFMGAVQVANYGESDSAYYTLFHPLRQKPAPNMVYLWSHEGYTIGEVTARTLDYFAFQNAVLVGRELNQLSPTAARTALGTLKDQFIRDYADMNGDELETEVELDEEAGLLSKPDLEQHFALTNYYWRARWIIQLLSPEGTYDFERDTRESFHLSMNRPIDDTDFVKRLDFGVNVAPVAVYFLWRSFWCKEEDRLSQCLAAYKNHKALVVRDLVALLEQIRDAGRNDVGPLKDIRGVRDNFLSLDLFTS